MFRYHQNVLKLRLNGSFFQNIHIKSPYTSQKAIVFIKIDLRNNSTDRLRHFINKIDPFAACIKNINSNQQYGLHFKREMLIIFF